jgi:phytoene dehydrogenase-like protein
MRNDHDAIIVGSGLGGLSTGAYLATNGKRVLVLEQYDVAGGCSQTFRRKRQWQFDVGLHYVGGVHRGAIGSVLRGVGLEGRMDWVEMDPDGFDTLRFPDHEVRVPASWERYGDRLAAAFPSEAEALHRCVKIMRDVARDLRGVAMPNSKLDLVRFPFRARSMVLWGMRPMTQLFDHCRLSAQARAVIVAQSGDYATPPSRTPVALHAGLLDHYFDEGAYYLRGGGQTLAAHLLDVIHTHGGRVRTRARVERIAVERGRARGVVLGHRRGDRAGVRWSSTGGHQADVRSCLGPVAGARPGWREAGRGLPHGHAAVLRLPRHRGDLRDEMPNTNTGAIADYTPRPPTTPPGREGSPTAPPVLHHLRLRSRIPTGGRHAPRPGAPRSSDDVDDPVPAALGRAGADPATDRYSPEPATPGKARRAERLGSTSPEGRAGRAAPAHPLAGGRHPR